jgi:hypothetical protein
MQASLYHQSQCAAIRLLKLTSHKENTEMDTIQPQIKEEIRDAIIDAAVIEIANKDEEIKALKAEISKLKGENK